MLSKLKAINRKQHECTILLYSETLEEEVYSDKKRLHSGSNKNEVENKAWILQTT